MRALITLVALFGTFSFLGGRDLWLAMKADAEPDQLTVRQLIARGAEGNPYVEVSDFFLGDNFVYEEKDGTWRTVWLPIGPAENQGEPLTSVKLVVKTNSVKSEADLPAIAATPGLRGMIMNHISSMGSEEHKILSSSYPGTNLNDVLIFELNKDPAQMKKMGGAFFGIGLTGLLVTAIVAYRQFR